MHTSLGERYAELEKLGEGGMGQVIKARDQGLGREVAIKRLRDDADAEAPHRFLLEARATGQLEHPNIPPIYELGEDAQGKPYFALKLVKGASLADIITALDEGDHDMHDRFGFTHRLEIFQKVCEAVAYAHERGILHRDIKPENVMVGDFGEVFLMDWGLAKDEGAKDGFETQAGTFVGTPMYAAPEQVCGGKVDAVSDVYGLGATLYHWLSLRPPYQEKNVRLLLAAVLTKTPTDPVFFSHPVQGRLPVEMTRLVMKAIAKEPEKRFPSVNAMLEEVRRILDGDIAPICPCTTVKFGFHHVSRMLDNYPILVFLVLAWLLYPAYALGRWLYLWMHGSG